MSEILMHGARVRYEADAYQGINYLLHDIDREEAKVFFNEARRSGRAEFEDETGKNYTIVRNSDGTFNLERR